MKRTLGLSILLLALALRAGAEPGATRVARWPGDAKAAFLLMFDDSWPSHFQVAAPELARHGLTATFYINPGKGEYQKFRSEWESNVWKQILAVTGQQISVSVQSKTDPQLYDQPLTLVTSVPAAWSRCRVTQGTNQFHCAVADNAVKYPALPDGVPLTLVPEN